MYTLYFLYDRAANFLYDRAGTVHALWHPMGIISSETGVQQGDPLGPMFFCLMLHKLVTAITTDNECSSLLFHRWYIDDSWLRGLSLL